MQVIDSHTAGEPTRVVVSGGPDIGTGPLSDQARRFVNDYDHYRAAIINEPRGSEVMVGALLCKPHAANCDAGVIFFNSVGLLGMCGHGAIGLAVTLRHLDRTTLGVLRFDTPVGPVSAELLSDHRVRIDNVPSRRWRRAVSVQVPGHGEIVGDVAWGGNWFFLTKTSINLNLANVQALTAFAVAIRRSLKQSGITGWDDAEIDHVELMGPASSGSDARNFVLCPGGAYDRSPCGTGTSAKLACLAADGRLGPGEAWRQESVIGSAFEASYQVAADAIEPAAGIGPLPPDAGPWILPSIVGEAYVTAESNLILDPDDPFRWGLAIGGPS